MKRILLIALACVLFCLPAFAGSSQNINIPEKFIVAGKQMPPGEYKVSWKTEGSSVLVSLEQQGVFRPVTATSSASQVKAENGSSSYELDRSGGTPVLKTLIFRKFNLVFQQTAAKE